LEKVKGYKGSLYKYRDDANGEKIMGIV